MKNFFDLPAVLRCWALLACLGAASPNTFSVQDDLLAYPQYEVRFADDWTSEEIARSKLTSKHKPHIGRRDDSLALQDVPLSQVEQYQGRHSSGEDKRAKAEDDADYELMVLEGQKWLCRVPKVSKPEDATGLNETLSMVEEEKELARATDRGWELLSSMQGSCVYYISGWWSYSFCYNQGVKQFHQLPPSRGVPIYPPVEDPGVPGFTLGTYDKRIEDDGSARKDTWDGEGALEEGDGLKRKRSNNGELVQRGQSRYLVQTLGGGTMCDLTGKERKVEVQFHCNQQATDRISLIKETSTCAYLMVIQTPRLCSDVAFLPPQKDEPNAVTCSPILREDEVEDYERDLKTLKDAEREANILEAAAEAAAALSNLPYDPFEVPVGDIFVGERRLVPEGHYIEKSTIVGGGKETYIDTIADSEGKILGWEDLEKLGVSDAESVEKMKKQLEKIAKGQTWKLDVIDTPRGREYKAIIGDEEQEEVPAGKPDLSDQEGATGGKKDDAQFNRKDKTSRKQDGQKDKNAKKQFKGSEEEYYQEEL